MSETNFHMRRKDREITDPEKIRDIIKKATVCRLGLVDDNEAYIVPLNFGYENNCLYLHSALKGHKVDLLRKSNIVSFEIEGDYKIDKTEKSGCNVQYQSVIGKGTANIVENTQEKIRGLKSIMRQCTGSEYDFSPDRLNTVLIVRIDINTMTCKQAGF
jgi:nitroimidazol reductase NimA-like FMN-containing flavoprotein (pyridoxamine 5'-phosphate oxidase superfamily)